jgi:NAD(P)-dependent dehydrogenase (short-subunit alcohol dehydrogenase family)
VTDDSHLPEQLPYDKKVAVVTGSSSGIGYETALLLARNGFYAYATMRNLNKSNEITENAKKDSLPLKVLELNVASDESVSKLDSWKIFKIICCFSSINY